MGGAGVQIVETRIFWEALWWKHLHMKNMQNQTHVPSQASPQTLPMGLNFLFFLIFSRFWPNCKKHVKTKKQKKVQTHVPCQASLQTLSMGLNLLFLFLCFWFFHCFFACFSCEHAFITVPLKNCAFLQFAHLRPPGQTAWVGVLKSVLERYNNQKHSSIGTTPNKAHNLDNAVQVNTHLIMKEKRNRKYPNICEGDYVRIYDKGKGNYVSRKETRSQWTEKKYKVILVAKDLKDNRYYKLEGMSKRYNRHELLLVFESCLMMINSCLNFHSCFYCCLLLT